MQARNGSLFPSAIFTLYCTYLCYSALVSEPHDYICNGLGQRINAASATTLATGEQYSLRFGIACGVHRPCSVHRPCRLPGMCCYSVHDRSANTWARARLHCHPRHLISHTPYAAATAHDCCKAAGLLLEPDCILRTHARRQLCCCTLTIARDGFGWSALRSHTLARARSGRSGQESLHVQACCWRWCLWCTRRCGQAPTRPCSASRLTMGPLQSSRCWTTTLGGTM